MALPTNGLAIKKKSDSTNRKNNPVSRDMYTRIYNTFVFFGENKSNCDEFWLRNHRHSENDAFCDQGVYRFLADDGVPSPKFVGM